MNRKEHAARINEAWQKGVEAIIETGRRINDAREELGGYGEFEKMVRNDLHISPGTARKLLAIASNQIIADRSHVNDLPASWGTLYELVSAGNKGLDLEAAIKSGTVHPAMQRKDVKALLPPPQRDDDLEEPDKEDDQPHEDKPAINPLVVAWESASMAEQKSFLHSLGRKVLLEALAATKPSRFRRPPDSIDATVTDDFSDTLAARMRRGESVGAPEEPYETTALANGNGADHWAQPSKGKAEDRWIESDSL